MIYIYQADTFCVDCTEQIKAALILSGKQPEDPSDESSYDSDEWPKGPYSDDESDYPDFCGSHDDCKNAIDIGEGFKIGCPLNNLLTQEGVEYLHRMYKDADENVRQILKEHWGITYDL